MSAAKHTAGPWVYRADSPTGVIVAPNAPYSPSVATIDIGPLSEGEIAANARLIAAAPDLLAALQAVRHLVVTYSTLEEYGQVRAAIAKATGAEL